MTDLLFSIGACILIGASLDKTLGTFNAIILSIGIWFIVFTLKEKFK